MRADGRLLRRPVHRQHHGDGVGGAGACATGVGDAARGLFRAPRARAARRHARRPRSWRMAARCRATSSPANHWRTRPPSWRRPAARPMPACICPRSRTRPVCASRWTTSPRCSPARRSSPTCNPAGATSPSTCIGVGGTDAVLKALLDGGYLHGDALDAVGPHSGASTSPTTAALTARSCGRPRRRCSPTGGVIVLRGNLAPDGALIKVAGLKALVFEGRARVFDGEEACFVGRARPRNTGRRCLDHPQRGAQGRAGHARDAGRHRAASTARAWAKRWPSSPMAASPARPGA